jgi:hypothetical protein
MVVARESCGLRSLEFRRDLKKWSGRVDLNHRPPGPEPGALARLRYAPNLNNVGHQFTWVHPERQHTMSLRIANQIQLAMMLNIATPAGRI